MFWKRRHPAELQAEQIANKIRSQLSRLGYTFKRKLRDGSTVVDHVEFEEPIIARPESVALPVDLDRLPDGITIADLRKPETLETLSVATGYTVQGVTPKGGGFGYVVDLQSVNERIPSLVKLADMQAPPNAPPLTIPLGSTGDRLAWDDLRSLPHLLIAGATGQGKSVAVNAILCWLAAAQPPERLKMILIDLKGGMELSLYEGLPHVLDLITVAREVPAALASLQQEMDRRTRLMRGKARDLDEYNAQAAEPLPYLLLVVDEIANAMLSRERVKLEFDDGTTRVGTVKSETEALLADLAARARATGIHLIISTQRPSVDVITGLIKANFPARIAFGTASDVDSRVVIDHPGAQGLKPGRCLFRRNMDLIEIQGAFIGTDEVRKWLKLVKDGKLQPARDPMFDLALDVLAIADKLGDYNVDRLARNKELRDLGIGEYKIQQATAFLVAAGVLKQTWRRGKYRLVDKDLWLDLLEGAADRRPPTRKPKRSGGIILSKVS